MHQQPAFKCFKNIVGKRLAVNLEMQIVGTFEN
jgi:hypothetical protein